MIGGSEPPPPASALPAGRTAAPPAAFLPPPLPPPPGGSSTTPLVGGIAGPVSGGASNETWQLTAFFVAVHVVVLPSASLQVVYLVPRFVLSVENVPPVPSQSSRRLPTFLLTWRCDLTAASMS